MYDVPKSLVKICAACYIEKPLSNFTISGRDGYRNRRCKICISQKKEEVVANDNEKKCSACFQVRPLSSFYKRAHLKDGYDPRCKVCIRNKVYNPSFINKFEKYEPDPAFDKIFRLKSPKVEDYVETYKFFERIGYDLQSSKTIHQQFCERHNLPEHIRKKQFPDYHSKESLKNFLN